MRRIITDAKTFIEDDVSAVKLYLEMTGKSVDTKIHVLDEGLCDLSEERHALLVWAVIYNAKNIARLLLDRGAVLETGQGHVLDDPLHFACKFADGDMVRLLAEHALKNCPKALAQPGSQKWTPLHCAFHAVNIEALEVLADMPFTLEPESSADIYQQSLQFREGDRQFLTCPSIKKMHYKAQLFECIDLGHGVDVFKQVFNQHPVNLDCLIIGGSTLLDRAFRAGKNHHQLLKFMLMHGANPDFRKAGDDPLSFYAIAAEDTETLALLLEAGASLDAIGESGLSLIDFAKLVAVQSGSDVARQNVDIIQQRCDQIFLKRCLAHLYNPDRILPIPKFRR